MRFNTLSFTLDFIIVDFLYLRGKK